jgi:hypothetical protein
MTDGGIDRACSARNVTEAELLLYGMRHVQHHAAQLNLVCGRRLIGAGLGARRSGR